MAHLNYSIEHGLRVVHRPICAIASDIRREWGAKVNYAAKPYLSAMLSLDSASDSYGADSARSVCLYFLANAASFRGEAAKQLKAELRAAIK